jgi:hypothetical protein
MHIKFRLSLIVPHLECLRSLLEIGQVNLIELIMTKSRYQRM